MSSNKSVASPTNETVTFTPFELIYEIAIDGVKDVSSDLDRQFYFTVMCTSADLRFEQAIVRSNSAFTLDVPFPMITDVFPATIPLIGQQITIRGVGFLSDHSTIVGRTLVSGPSVERTIMVNETDDSLWEITLLNPDALAWISSLGAGAGRAEALPGSAECVHSNGTDRRVGEAGNRSYSGLQRRKPVGDFSAGGVGGSVVAIVINDTSIVSESQSAAVRPPNFAVVNQSAYFLIEAPKIIEIQRAYDKTWYDATLANKVARNVSDDLPLFHAMGTYADWSALPAVALNLSNFSILGFVVPGPMCGRDVLGVANAFINGSVEVDPQTGEITVASYLVVRERVQAFNFTTVGSELSFVSPPREQIVLQDLGDAANGGYTEIEITSPTGPGLRLSSALFYTESCTQEGWFVDGSRCRPCPFGGYA
jgi:hypothetical protein